MADSALQDLDQRFSDARSARRSIEPQWFLNLAYHDGYQWVAYDGSMLFEPQLEDWRAKVTDNRIRPIVRVEVSRMTKSRPVWVGVPKDDSDQEQASARLRERVFEHYSRHLELPRKLRQALTWSRIVGAGFWKIYWDSTQGKKMKVLAGPDGKIIKNSYGKPISMDEAPNLPAETLEGLKAHELGMGEPCFEVPSPFGIYPDPLAGEEGLETAGWLFEETVKSLDYVRSRFNADVAPDASASTGALESRLPGHFGRSTGDARKTGVKLREFWAPPCTEFPKGKWAVSNGERVLHEDDNPYPDLPYVMFRGGPSPGRFWPDCVVTDLISGQTELNKRESQIAENAERIGNAPLMRSSVNEDVEWHGLPGEEIVFQDTGTPNSMPQFLNVPEVPGYVREDVTRITDAMKEISGHYEISAGGVPAGVTAAAAINLLLEQNDTVLGPDIEEMELSISGAGRRLLRMLRDYADDERWVRLAGEDGAWDLAAFKADQLGDCDEDAVQAGSGIPQSKAAKQAAIQEVLNMFAQMQVPLPERDLRRVLGEYQVAGLEKFFASIDQSERQVQRENQQLSTGGQPLPINSYDEDDVHVDGHQEYMRSSRFAELDDPVKALFEQHVALHLGRQSQMAAQQQQEQMMAAMGGAPPPPPGAAGPPAGDPAAAGANGAGAAAAQPPAAEA